MYSSKTSKVTTKSSSHLRNNGGRTMVSSSSRNVNSSHAGVRMCSHGCIEGDMKDSSFSEHGNISDGQKMMYSASETVKSSNAGGKMCRHEFIEDDMQGSKDSGIAEDSHMSGGQTMMYSASETVNSSHVGEAIRRHEVEGDVHNNKDNGRTQQEQISSRQKMMYSVLETRNQRSHGEGKMCRHGVLTGDTLRSKDNDFMENDNMSQGSNEYESYNEINQRVSYQNVLHPFQTSEDFRIELSESDEEALKEELLHIFERERTTLEMYFRTKMEERLREFRSSQVKFEKATRAEKLELENNMSVEKMEMQDMFRKEIAKLEHSSIEERQQLEVYYQEQLKDLREKLEAGQKQMDEKFAREKMVLTEKLEAEYQAMVRKEISHEKQEATREKSELEAQFHKEKLELEKTYNMRLTEAEESLQRLKAEFEGNLTQERMRMEKQSQDNIMELDAKLQEERRLRHDKERELEQDRAKYSKEDYLIRTENERLKNDVDTLRREINEKNRETVQLKAFEEKVKLKGREGLEGKLKDDFEKLVTDHKMELDKNFHRDKQKLDETLQAERRQMKDEHDREKEKIKLEQDDIIRTKERLRVEEQAQVDRRQQQRSDGDLVRPHVGDHRVEITGRVPDKGIQPEQNRQNHIWAKPHLDDQHVHLTSGTNHSEIQQQQKSDNESVRPAFHDHHIEFPSGTMDSTKNHQPFAGHRSSAQSGYTSSYQPGNTGSYQPGDTGSHQPGDTSIYQPRDTDIHHPGDTDSHQPGTTGSYQPSDTATFPQYPHNAHNMMEDPMSRSHHHHTTSEFQQHQKKEFPRNQPLERETGSGSIHQSGHTSLYHASPESVRELQSELIALKSENDGLKAKITALEENIDLHKKYKKEAKAEMERLLKANQEYEIKIQSLSREVEKSGKRATEEVHAKGRHRETHVKQHAVDDRPLTTDKNSWELEGKIKGLQARASRAEKREKENDSKMRLVDERRKEKRREDDLAGQWSVSRQKDQSRYESVTSNDREDPHYKAKYEATLREKNKLLQVTKNLQTKIKTLQEKQTEILRHSSHLEKSSEKNGETERLKQLVSENSSLKERTTELQTQLQRLLEKLKNEKAKAASLETELSSHKSESLHNIQHLQERLIYTGRELSGSPGSLDPDALRRIEQEIVTIGQIVKTQFGDASMGHVSYRSANEDMARVSQLEAEKTELETKLKIAREAMSEYVTLLNDKMQDVKSMTGMSEEMVQELHSRNNSLKRNLQALEEGQKTSHLQNEQLRHQKSVLQNLIGDLCRDEEVTGTSYKSSSRFLDSSHEGGHDEMIGTLYTSPRYMDYKYKSKYGGIYDNRYGHEVERNTEGRYLSEEFREMHAGEKFCGSKTDQYSTVSVEYPSGHSSLEYKDAGSFH